MALARKLASSLPLLPDLFLTSSLRHSLLDLQYGRGHGTCHQGLQFIISFDHPHPRRQCEDASSLLPLEFSFNYSFVALGSYMSIGN